MNRTRSKQGTRQSRGFRPSLEVFEDRLALACAVTTGDFDGDGFQDIRIVGDKRAQRLTIEDNAGISIKLTLDCNGDGDVADAGEFDHAQFNQEFRTFDVRLKAGGDVASYETLDDHDNNRRILNFNLGGGSDSLTANLHLLEIRGNSNIELNVLAGGGNDTVTTREFDDLADTARFTANADLGKGNDHFLAKFSQPALDLLDAANLHFQVAGGPGNDTLAAESSSNSDGALEIESGTLLQFFLNGDAGNDSISMAFQGFLADLDGGLLIKPDGGEGNDTISINVAVFKGTFGSSGILDIDILGNAGDDVLNLSVASDPQVSYDTGEQIILDGGLGTDACTATLTDVPAGTLQKVSCES